MARAGISGAHRGCSIALLLALFVGTSASAGEAYPVKPIRVLVGFPPGGPVDLQARVILPKLGDALHQPVVIENRPGADGAVGSEIVARAAPDGYTLLYGNAGHVTNQILHKNRLPFDAIRDFTPLGLLTASAYLLIVHPSVPANSIADLIALARAKPGQLSYGSAGNGSFAHLAGELLKASARIDLVHVPYKGGAGSLSAVLGGEIPVAFVGIPPTLPHVRSGKVKALGVTARERVAALPQVPTIAEAGFPDFDVSARYGFFAPARTPEAIVMRVNTELRAILGMPNVRERLALLGLQPIPGSPEEHAAEIKAEFARWTPIIKATGMRVD
jgi:tripartite-type tricarboxylate transporter receptor subunit TctC